MSMPKLHTENVNTLRNAASHIDQALKAIRIVYNEELERYYYLAYPGSPVKHDYDVYLKSLSKMEQHLSKSLQRVNIILVTDSLKRED